MFRLVLNFVELGDKKITYVEAGDGAGGVSGDELHLDAELAVEELLLGVESSGAGAPVEVEHHHLLAGSVVPRADGAVRGELGEPGPRRRGDLQEREGDGEQSQGTPPCHCGCSTASWK